VNRRNFLQLAAAAAAAAPLAACSSKSSASASSGGDSGPVELTVSVWSMATTPEFQVLFDAFHKANPSITVKPVDILAADYPTKVTTMLAAGDSTDVITMKNVIDYARYAGRGQLKDISDLAAAGDGAGSAAWTPSRRRTASTTRCPTGRTSGSCTTTRSCSTPPASPTRRTSPGTSTRTWRSR